MFYESLEHNIAVSTLFIYHWLSGVGHFFYNGQVEDSATAEISRCQVWQCLRHGVSILHIYFVQLYIANKFDNFSDNFGRYKKTNCIFSD